MQDFEIIYEDDCSTDTSRDILKEYANKDNRISCIYHSKNMSQSQARKDGVLRSLGKYVMFLDSDDYLEPNAFEVACKAIEEKGTDLVQFETIVENCYGLSEEAIAAKNKSMQYSKGVIHGNINLLNGCFAARREAKFNIYVWNKIYRGDLCRKTFAAIEDGIFPYGEDLYLTFLVLYNAGSISIIEDKLYHYCLGNGNSGHEKLSVKQFTITCKNNLIPGLVKRFVAKLPDSEQENLKPSMEYIKRLINNSTIARFYKLLPDDWEIEDVQAICSSLDPADTAFVITAFQEKLKRQRRELLNYSDISLARIDIKNQGADTNDVDIVEISDPDAKITEPKWACENGHGHMVKSTAGTLDMKLKCTGQGKLMIALRGMDIKKPDGERWPLWIDYTKFVVDDKVMFDKVKPIWHNKPYRFTTEAEDGKIITLHIEWVSTDVAVSHDKEQS